MSLLESRTVTGPTTAPPAKWNFCDAGCKPGELSWIKGVLCQGFLLWGEGREGLLGPKGLCQPRHHTHSASALGGPLGTSCRCCHAPVTPLFCYEVAISSSDRFRLGWEPHVPAFKMPNKQNQIPFFSSFVPETKWTWPQVWHGSLFLAPFQSNCTAGFIKTSKLWATSVTSV